VFRPGSKFASDQAPELSSCTVVRKVVGCCPFAVMESDKDISSSRNGNRSRIAVERAEFSASIVEVVTSPCSVELLAWLVFDERIC
jgi:hypothetical protein